MGACRGARTVALRTVLDAVDGDLFITAECGLLKGNHHGLADGFALTRCVCAAASAASAEAAETAAEEAAENIAQIDIVKSAEAACAATAVIRIDAGKAELIVAGAFVLVRQNAVCLAGLLELFGRLRIVFIQIRMVLFGELSIGFLDFVIRRALAYAKHLIIISFVVSHMLCLQFGYGMPMRSASDSRQGRYETCPSD